MISSTRWLPRLTTAVRRSFATRRKTKETPLPPAILNALPVFEDEEDTPIKEKDTSAAAVFPNNPITSAHCIDVPNQKLSQLDSVALKPDGSIVHGRYGTLGDAAAAIPLEFLALLHPAAEGAAALRALKTKGTVVIYGATQANGFAAAQIGCHAMGQTIVGVVDGNHSGNEEMMEYTKGLIAEPGTAVCEEYALSKKLFADLVEGISTGDEGIQTPSPEDYLKQFKENFYDYCETYPDTRPAAVSARHLEFNYMEKDRAMFEENMAAYLEQFPPGAPPMEKERVEALFTTEQYEIFRKKFWNQTTGVISGDEGDFSAPHIVKQQIDAPEELDSRTFPGAGPKFPYSFSVLDQYFPEGSQQAKGGPITGAIICVTPTLKKAAEVVAKESTLRAKAEALAFLTKNEKAAFGAACSVAAIARKHKAPIVTVGGTLPGLETVKVQPEDVTTALQAMDIGEDGESALNYFVQCYRANDFPFYADYAVHRASEPLAGPRQLIVTK